MGESPFPTPSASSRPSPPRSALTGLGCKAQARLSLPFRGPRCLRSGGGCGGRGAGGDDAPGRPRRRGSSRWGCSLQLWKQEGGGGVQRAGSGGTRGTAHGVPLLSPSPGGPGHSRASSTAASPSSASSRLASSRAHSPHKCQSGGSPRGRQPVGRRGGTEPLSSAPLPVFLSPRPLGPPPRHPQDGYRARARAGAGGHPPGRRAAGQAAPPRAQRQGCRIRSGREAGGLRAGGAPPGGGWAAGVGRAALTWLGSAGSTRRTVSAPPLMLSARCGGPAAP